VSISRPTGCSPTWVPRSPVDTRSTTPHFPDRVRVEVMTSGQRPRPLAREVVRIALKELGRVLAHENAHVVLGLGQQTVGVNEREAVRRLERVPLMDVAVNEDGALVVVRPHASRRAGECLVDGALGAGAVEGLPCRRDEVGEQSALRRAGGQTAVGRRTPDPFGRRAEDLVPPPDREREPSEAPSRSSRSAPRAASSRSSRAHPAPFARRSTVISFPAASPERGTSSFSTAGVPSPSVASATNASVASS
jgi:hypothetical protein